MLPKLEDKKARVFYAIIVLLVILFVYLVLVLARRSRGDGPVAPEGNGDIGVEMQFPEGHGRELEDSKLKAYQDEERARRSRSVRDRNITGMWADIAEDSKPSSDGADGDDIFESMFGKKNDRGGDVPSDEELLQRYYAQSYVDPQSIKGGEAAPRHGGGGGGGGGGAVSRPALPDPEPQAAAPSEPAVEEVPADAGGRGVVHSMRDEMRSGRTASGGARTERAKSAVSASSSPVRCQFVRDEEIASGARVTVRLLDPLHLDGGVVVPANSRLSATCTVGDRLGLSFAGFSLNGNLYSINYTAYDNDGLPGLYCSGGGSPVGNSARRQAVDEAVNIAQGTVAGTGIVGRIASGALGIGRMAMNGTGQQKVQVPSGYTFYIVENIKR